MVTALEDLNGWDVAPGGMVTYGFKKQNWYLSVRSSRFPENKIRNKFLVRITVQRRQVSFSAMSYLLFWDRPSPKV